MHNSVHSGGKEWKACGNRQAHLLAGRAAAVAVAEFKVNRAIEDNWTHDTQNKRFLPLGLVVLFPTQNFKSVCQLLKP
jgi:hypothetical protein